MLLLLLYLTAVVHFSTCGATNMCQGGSQCVLCTLTGPTIIDINGHFSSFQDRCAYTLMETNSIPGLKVHGTFKERRRTDVSLLDSVILQLDKQGVNIHLEQGGRVLVGNVTMTLSASAQLVHGVELSQDKEGVTAKISHSKYVMTVLFDGTTAQINIEGPSGQAPSVEGLCGNADRSFSEEKVSDYSPTDCEVQHEDFSNMTIMCKQMTERCNLLKGAIFSACKSYVDPQPYITACSSTLCKYPRRDNLDCQFLEAYVRACRLYSANILNGWESKAICPEELCRDHYCSAHEFCGVDNLSETRCHCRAIFASTYRSQNILGDTACNQTSRSITLVGCLLADRGIHYSDLHLYDKTCRAEMNNATHMVTIGFDSRTNPCGTMVRLDKNGFIVNKNGVIVESTKEELMDFTCPFVIPEIKIDFSVGIKVYGENSSAAIIQYVTSEVWNYTLTMKGYTDAGRTQLVDSNTELHLDQKVWFALEADGLDGEIISLVTQSCYATCEPEADASLRYDLIIDGCPNPADKTVQVERNGEGTSCYFSFNMFEFYGKNGQVYLHCKLNLCVKEGNTCAPSCSPTSRQRRSPQHKYSDDKPAILLMAWNT